MKKCLLLGFLFLSFVCLAMESENAENSEQPSQTLPCLSDEEFNEVCPCIDFSKLVSKRTKYSLLLAQVRCYEKYHNFNHEFAFDVERSEIDPELTKMVFNTKEKKYFQLTQKQQEIQRNAMTINIHISQYKTASKQLQRIISHEQEVEKNKAWDCVIL